MTDPAVNNTVTTFKNTDTIGGSEPSISVNPANPNQVVLTAFSGSWSGGNAPLWLSSNGGSTWTKVFTVPPPPGVSGTAVGCPCDQGIGFNRTGTLFGTFLYGDTSTRTYQVVTGSTTNPSSSAAWSWFGNPVQRTNRASNNADQPQIVVNRDPAVAAQDNTYVAYDDFNGSAARVSASYGLAPPNFTSDQNAGPWQEDFTNPGLRLAGNRTTGAMYALWQTAILTTGLTQRGVSTSPHTVTLHLNRSIDGGHTWSLNGSSTGIAVGTPFLQTEGVDPKFGTVNALLGGIDAVAVDPAVGVYVAYGVDGGGIGSGDQLYLTLLTANASGQLGIAPGYPRLLSSAPFAALPSLAVTTDGTVGVEYTTFTGFAAAPNNYAKFQVHFARSYNHGASFSDVVLETFQSPVFSDGPGSRQRIFGDFQELTTVGNQFDGTFGGNRVPFNPGGTISVIDPIFFTVPSRLATTTAVTSSPNPSTQGQPVTLTATVSSAPGTTPTGTVQFTNNGANLGSPVTLVAGKASLVTSTLPKGTDVIKGIYNPLPPFSGSTSPPHNQIVN